MNFDDKSIKDYINEVQKNQKDIMRCMPTDICRISDIAYKNFPTTDMNSPTANMNFSDTNMNSPTTNSNFSDNKYEFINSKYQSSDLWIERST